MITVNNTNETKYIGDYILMRGPRPISEAKTDGTKYIVWDKDDKEWYVSYYDKYDGWVDHVSCTPLNYPTHFVEYLDEPK